MSPFTLVALRLFFASLSFLLFYLIKKPVFPKRSLLTLFLVWASQCGHPFFIDLVERTTHLLWACFHPEQYTATVYHPYSTIICV